MHHVEESPIFRKQGSFRPASSKKRNRAGAVFSLELILTLPIVLIIGFAAIEFCLLLMGMQRVQAASAAACRVATLPANDVLGLDEAMDNAAIGALGTEGLVANYSMESQIGVYPGDPVRVVIRVPMNAAAPDFLRALGFSLQDRELIAQTQMCKQ